MRAKFVIDSKTEMVHGVTLKATAVYQGEPGSENSKFWEATPCGTLELQTINKDAADKLPVGVEVYIDITVATPVEEE